MKEADYMGEFPGCGEHFRKGHWYASVRILSFLPRQEKYRLVNQVSSTGLEQTYSRIRSNAEKRVTIHREVSNIRSEQTDSCS